MYIGSGKPPGHRSTTSSTTSTCVSSESGSGSSSRDSCTSDKTPGHRSTSSTTSTCVSSESGSSSSGDSIVMALVVLVTRHRVIAVLAVENPQLKVVIRLSIILSFFRLGLHSSAGCDSIVGNNRKYYSIPRVALVNQCDSSGSYR